MSHYRSMREIAMSMDQSDILGVLVAAALFIDMFLVFSE